MKHFVANAILIIASTLLVHTALTHMGLFRPEASVQGAAVDWMFGIHLWVISFLFSLIVVILIYSLIVFRRKQGESGDGAYLLGNTGLEVTWTVLPILLVLYLAGVGGISLAQTRQIDPSALQIHVIASQWNWNFLYPDYGFASKDLYLPINQQVDLQMTSTDVIHSFWVPEFRIKQDILPGRTIDLRITPTVAGKYTVSCNQLCGLRHTYMTAPVYVVSEADFQAWVAQEQASAPTDPALRGELLVQQYGCLACHTTDGSKKIGPTWKGVFGSQVKLADGTTVQADQNYLINSILNPNQQIVEGFSPDVMPNFGSVISQQDAQNIAAYLQTLK